MASWVDSSSQLALLLRDDEQDACDGGVGHGFGYGRHDGVIGNVNAVGSLVAHTGHKAAFHGSVQKSLGGGVLGIGLLGRAAAEGDSETKLVGVDLFTGQRRLVAKGSEAPALGGFNGNRADLDRTEGVIDDLGISGSRNRAVRADGDGQNGGDGDAHFGGCGIAAQRAVCGAGERDVGRAGAAGGIHGVGGGSADGEGCNHADRENERDDLLKVFHNSRLLFIM